MSVITPVYFDYAATTPVDPGVADIMSSYLTAHGSFANPASTHILGKNAKHAVEIARTEVAQLIHAEPEEIIWTSGATEANNLALKGAATMYERQGKHIITVKTEHKSILDCCQYLEKQGFSVTYLTPKKNGLIDLDLLQQAITKETILVSVLHVNNETGVIQDIASIAKITEQHGILLHVDAAQSAGKILLDVKKIPIDLMSLSAHKIYGPKGIGALYVRKKPRVRVAAQIHGGGQELGMRSGTLPTHQIVGMGKAFALAAQNRERDLQHVTLLRERLLKKLQSDKILLNSDIDHSYPGIVNISFLGYQAKELIHAIPEIAMSTSSACFDRGIEPSYVLRAMGLKELDAAAALRLSFGRFSTMEEVDYVADCFHHYFLRSPTK